jgi:hypothetical protein
MIRTASLTTPPQEECSFLKVHPTELARQLTLIEFSMFSKITPSELMFGNWKRDCKVSDRYLSTSSATFAACVLVYFSTPLLFLTHVYLYSSASTFTVTLIHLPLLLSSYLFVYLCLYFYLFLFLYLDLSFLPRPPLTLAQKEVAPHVVEVIDWFNRMIAWITSEILCAPNTKTRRTVLSRFIQVAGEFRKINNFNGV